MSLCCLCVQAAVSHNVSLFLSPYLCPCLHLCLSLCLGLSWSGFSVGEDIVLLEVFLKHVEESQQHGVNWSSLGSDMRKRMGIIRQAGSSYKQHLQHLLGDPPGSSDSAEVPHSDLV